MSRKESIFWGVMVIISFLAIFLYIYFTRSVSETKTPEVSKNTFYDQILLDNNTILFRNVNTKYDEVNTKVLYRTRENNINVYYFAGNAQNNWVEFANMYFRIIRTDKDNNVKLLYSGTNIDGKDAFIGESPYSMNGRANFNSSNIKAVLDNWYQSNLKLYEEYIFKNSVYCNKVSSNNINLECKETERYVNTSSSVALITLEELLFIGSKVNEVSNTWVNYNGKGEPIINDGSWATMSYSKNNINENLIVVGNDIEMNPIIKEDNLINSYKVRPVITLKSCVSYESGDGSINNPYKLSLSDDCKISE